MYLGTPPIRPTVAVVDLSAIARNLRRLKEIVGSSVGIMAVVKADAYGHGAPPVARMLEGLGVWGLAVATVEEGVQLRDTGVRARIVVMGAAFGNDHREVIARDLVPMVGDPRDVDGFARAAQAEDCDRFGIHVKVDTGMTRLGVVSRDFETFLRRCHGMYSVRVNGIATHFACAEEADAIPTERQLELFVRCLDQARVLGADPLVVHAANSAATLRFPAARFDLVRPGLALYGVLPSPSVPDPGLAAATSWYTHINALRDVPAGTAVSYGGSFVAQRQSCIATLPVGYADGYPRSLSNRAQVQIVSAGGTARRAPVVGRICMDLTTVDVTDVPGVSVGDRVWLIGGRGESAIHVDELATWASTIPYEILAGISKRVPRVYPRLDPAEVANINMGGAKV